MLELIPGIAVPRRSWRRARATWVAWSTLDPLTQEYEGERIVRGIALGLVLSFVMWTASWLVWRFM
jgi:hypothetical protein